MNWIYEFDGEPRGVRALANVSSARPGLGF